MPVYLRKFYYKKLSDTKTEENKQIEKVQKTSNLTPQTNPRFKR